MRKLILSLTVFVIASCAMKAEQVNLFSLEVPTVSVCGDALQSTIGIAPILDRRPEAEKAGKRPGGIFLLLWNQRIGDYMSSDKDFLEPVEQVLAEQIGFHVSKTNCFFETKVLPSKVPPQPSAEDLLLLLGKEKVQYVLTGQLKHFYGKQRQRAYFYALPAFYVDFFGWGNDVGISEGHAEILFTLYDTQTGQEVWRDNITGESTSPVTGSYPKAAADAFHDASQKLANGLYRFAQFQKGSPLITKPENL